MAKHKGKLTKKAIDAWTYAQGSTLWDGQLSGFLLTVYPSGTKVFCIDYRNRYGKKRRYRIGKYGRNGITLEQARNRAKQLLALIALEGFDPLEQKSADRTALSVNDLLDRYLESGKFAEKAESTRYVDRGRLNRHIRPLLGNVKLKDVTPDKARKAYSDIRDGKTATTQKTKVRGKARVKGGAGAARMAIRVLRAIFNWGISEGLMTTNPADHIKLGADGIRTTVLETGEQYRRLFEALKSLDATHQLPKHAADAIRILALTGARRDEVAACLWRYIDMERGLIVLPPTSHKTGHKTGKPKEIPLPAAALAIITKQEPGAPDDYVFPGKTGGHVQLSARLWAKIRKEANLPEGIANHALRHSLGTMLAQQGAEAAQIMAALGHHQLSTTGRYIHPTQDGRAQLLEKHTAGIAAALSGDGDRANVASIKRGRKL